MSDPIIGGTTATAAINTYTYTLSTYVGTIVGDVLILDVLLFKLASFTPGTDTVTVPAGWTSLGGIPESGAGYPIRRQYWKFASSGDLVANSIVVSFGTAWNTGASSRFASLTTVHGGTGIVGGPHSSGRGPVAVNFNPTMPDPPAGKPVVALMYTYGSFGGGSGFVGGSFGAYIGGWGPWVDAANATQRGHGPPPFGPLTFGLTPANVGFNTFAVSLPPATCQVFKGKIVATTTVANVVLSPLSGFPGSGSDYRIKFVTNTTGHSIADGGPLTGAYTIGAMRPGTIVEYQIYRTDGAHIDGGVMRAADSASGLHWDVTVQCPANPWGYNLSFGQRSGL